MVRHHHFDGCRVIHLSGRDNLEPDALSCQEELLSLWLFVLVEDDLDEVENELLDDVREAMKHDEVAVTNNWFLDERGSKKNPQGGRRMKNLRRKNGLHCSKKQGCTSR